MVVLRTFFIILVGSIQTSLSESEGESNMSTSNGNYPDSDDSADNCAISVAVLPWPPYAGNGSNHWQSKVIKQLRDADIYSTVNKTSSEGDLKKLFQANKIDIGFPLITRCCSASYFEKPILNHPGLDFLVAPQHPTAGEVCVSALLYSWPLLALSLIFTVIAGILIWMLEVIDNREEFPKSFARGTWEGFWWAFISMTTVGYGDKCPRSIAGRCFAVIWIFAGVILVAVFMANVTTALTSVSAKPEYKLSEAQVGVVSKSLEEELASNYSAEIKVFENYHELMTAFRLRQVHGIVIDHYIAEVLLDKEKAFRQQIRRSKHFSLNMKYEVTVNISQKIIDSENCLQSITDHIKEVMTKQFYSRKEKQWVRNSGYLASSQSFNLFKEYKKTLEQATYISLGILAGLIFVGLMSDKIFRKTRSHKTRGHELKVDKDTQILQDIAKGKELLKELHLLHQKLEEKINMNSDRKRNYPENGKHSCEISSE